MTDRKAGDRMPSIVMLTGDETLDPQMVAVKRLIDDHFEFYPHTRETPAVEKLVTNLVQLLRLARQDSRRIDAMGLAYHQRAAPTLGIREVTFKMPCGTDPMTLLPLTFRKVLDLVIKARAL